MQDSKQKRFSSSQILFQGRGAQASHRDATQCWNTPGGSSSYDQSRIRNACQGGSEEHTLCCHFLLVLCPSPGIAHSLSTGWKSQSLQIWPSSGKKMPFLSDLKERLRKRQESFFKYLGLEKEFVASCFMDLRFQGRMLNKLFVSCLLAFSFFHAHSEEGGGNQFFNRQIFLHFSFLSLIGSEEQEQY